MKKLTHGDVKQSHYSVLSTLMMHAYLGRCIIVRTANFEMWTKEDFTMEVNYKLDIED